MKTLIVEDDLTSRIILKEVLKGFGPVVVVSNGKEAFDTYQAAWEAGEPFDLVTLDIMMPEVDGHVTLRKIREADEARGLTTETRVKVVMTTALDDPKNISTAFSGACDAYFVKPIRKANLLDELQKMGLIT